jgi:hypothetical protein
MSYDSYIITSVYYIFGAVCASVIVWEQDPCVKEVISKAQINVSESEDYVSKNFFMLLCWTMIATFILALFILFLIVKILILVKNDKKKLYPVRLWLVTHSIYMLIILEVLFCMKMLCFTKPRKVIGPSMLSLFNTIFALFFLVVFCAAKACEETTRHEHDTNIQEVSQNTDLQEVCQNSSIQEAQQNIYSHEVHQNESNQEVRQNTNIQEVHQNTNIQEVRKNSSVEDDYQNTDLQEVCQNSSIQEVCQNTNNKDVYQKTNRRSTSM